MGWLLLEPGFFSLLEALARRAVARAARAAAAPLGVPLGAPQAEPLTLRLLRLFDASRGMGVTAALPTLP